MRNLAEVSLRPENVASLKREWTAGAFVANASVSTVTVDASGVHLTRTIPETAEDVLDVVDPARGKVLSEIRSALDAPNLAGGRIVVRDTSGHLRAYDHATHELLWSTEQTESTARLATPVIDGTSVFARGSSGNEAALYAFNAATGVRRWKIVLSAGGGAGYYAPSVGGGNVYVADGTGSVQARSEQTGGLSWKVGLGPTAPPEFTPSYLDGTVYVPASTNVRALDAATGSEQWHSTGILHPNSGIAIGTTQVFFTTYDGR